MEKDVIESITFSGDTGNYSLITFRKLTISAVNLLSRARKRG
jgi:hypothetical protein